MSDSNVPAQLIRLQNALLEGRIDRDTYEQLKSDLLRSLEAGNGASTFHGNDFPQTPVEPPPENPFKKKADFPRVIKTVKFRDLTRPATQPIPAAGESTVSEKRPSPGIGVTRPLMTPLPFKERAPRIAAMSAESAAIRSDETDSPSPTAETPNASIETIKRSLREPHTWRLVGAIAAHCGIVMGFRAWAMNHSTLPAALFWGVESAIHGGAGALLWKLVHDACLDYRGRDHDALKMGLAQFAWTMLLLIAASFWVYVGMLYGGLVGTILGGRLGFLTAAGGEMIGGMIGLVKAVQGYRSSRDRMTTHDDMSDNDVSGDENDDEDDGDDDYR
ncbi:MAG: hypothetical protein WEB58_14680 [Planctomycetaceae bacterium]